MTSSRTAPHWQDFFKQSLSNKRATRSLRRRGGTGTSIAAEDAALQASTDDTVPANCSPPNETVDFGSNDYLGLRRDASVLESFRDSVEFGSGASPVLNGYSVEHQRLERTLAELSGYDDALVFSSGFGCNLGVLSCLADRGDLILSDQLNHASLIDGCRLSRAQVHVYPHHDVAALRSYLRQHRAEFNRALIVTESVFSMDGDQGDLVGLADLSDQFNCGLIVDEAHATGIYGSNGSGLVEELEIHDRVLLKLGTLSKAVGGLGGYACGSKEAIEYLVNSCRSYLFSTAPPAAIAHAARTALDRIREMPVERRELRALSKQFRIDLITQGWQVVSADSDSPIVPILSGDNFFTLEMSEYLHQRGFYVPAIRPPTVPVGKSRLRISLSVNHSSDQVAGLLATLSAFRQSKFS